jgi:hypothetical protein
MAMSAVKESPFFNNLIFSSFDYLPATRDLVVEEAWPRRVFRARQEEQQQSQIVRWGPNIASLCLHDRCRSLRRHGKIIHLN